MTAAEVAERIASECMGVTLKDGVVHPDLMTGVASDLIAEYGRQQAERMRQACLESIGALMTRAEMNAVSVSLSSHAVLATPLPIED